MKIFSDPIILNVTAPPLLTRWKRLKQSLAPYTDQWILHGVAQVFGLGSRWERSYYATMLTITICLLTYITKGNTRIVLK